MTAPAWNPDMAAAPRDGTWLILAWPARRDRPVVAMWDRRYGCWWADGLPYDATANGPVAFLIPPPLPAPPTGG